MKWENECLDIHHIHRVQRCGFLTDVPCVVCVCVCLYQPGTVLKRLNRLRCMWTRVGPRNQLLGGARVPPHGKGQLLRMQFGFSSQFFDHLCRWAEWVDWASSGARETDGCSAEWVVIWCWGRGDDWGQCTHWMWVVLLCDREIEVIKMLNDYKVKNITCCRFYASIPILWAARGIIFSPCPSIIDVCLHIWAEAFSNWLAVNFSF